MSSRRNHPSASNNNIGEEVVEGPSAATMYPEQPYKVLVTMRFLLLTVTASVLLAAATGHAARVWLLEAPRKALLERHHLAAQQQLLYQDNFTTTTQQQQQQQKKLPPPILQTEKEVPRTVYTSKNFDTARTSSTSMLVQREKESPPPTTTTTCDESTDGTCKAAKSSDGTSTSSTSPNDEPSNPYGDEDYDSEEYLPAGQHLLMDMKYLDSAFLNSEERLAHAMIEVTNQANLTLISYHCHSLQPSGVSCVGVLLESHISFHTWPEHGVITLDLFTCGSNPLLPVVAIMERLFGVPSIRRWKREPFALWSHKLRGFRHDYDIPLATYDLGRNILNCLKAEKNEIVSVDTEYQRVDVYDVIYKQKMSYYARNLELYQQPERTVLLDGVLQSRQTGESAYHEALVHPALLSHPHPKRVAIVGGGAGATLREVLKHKTVEYVKMIEIDQELIDVARQHVPGWSDCSDLLESTKSSSSWCGDDARADVVVMDGLKWFMDVFACGEAKEEQYDVIIVDALDPEEHVPFAETLYASQTYAQAIYNALTSEGIYVVQVGEPPRDVPEMSSSNSQRAVLAQNLQSVGFGSLHMYGESHARFTEEWNFMLVMKSFASRALFYRNAAELNLELQKRVLPTAKTPFKFFDGATMMYYQAPSKPFEEVFCLQLPKPASCKNSVGYDPKIPNIDTSKLEVKQSSLGANAGRGLFARVDIPVGAYLALEKNTDPVMFLPSTRALIHDIQEQVPQAKDLERIMTYIHSYGDHSMLLGRMMTTVDGGVSIFLNHGCNRTYNVVGPSGVALEQEVVDEVSSTESLIRELNETNRKSIYDPAFDRHLPQIIGLGRTGIREIKAGEELFNNYVEVGLLTWAGGQQQHHDWEAYISDIRDLCNNGGQQQEGDDEGTARRAE